jgi:hypothetical protein
MADGMERIPRAPLLNPSMDDVPSTDAWMNTPHELMCASFFVLGLVVTTFRECSTRSSPNSATHDLHGFCTYEVTKPDIIDG